jgi:predicted nucleic acid-binding protein
MITITLDTGALIAMEKQKPRGRMLMAAAREGRAELLTITPIVAEWWRGRTDVRERVKASVRIVPFPLDAAEASGVALGKMGEPKGGSRLTVDAMVMAFAATHGGALIYTSDVDDLSRLGGHFADVRILGI